MLSSLVIVVLILLVLIAVVSAPVPDRRETRVQCPVKT